MFKIVTLMGFILGLLHPHWQAAAGEEFEFSGEVFSEVRFFPASPSWPAQKDELDFSPGIELRLSKKWYESGNSLAFVPYFRWDSVDNERTHFDIRELVWRHQENTWGLGVGVDKVFWGVTEAYHLVDVINQTDLVEHPDEEEKLGQPMVNLTLQKDWGTLDLFYLPYFRERTFPGSEGRLRLQFPVSEQSAEYESDLEEWHPDFAVRYFHSMGMLDLGVAQFFGTNREPLFLPRVQGNGQVELIPFYEIVRQTSMEAQLTFTEWLFKLEMLYQAGGKTDYFAATGGFEYTVTGLFKETELGILGEWLYDDRKEKATTPYENDLFLGLRWVLNDECGSEVLTGVIRDGDDPGQVFLLEISRRLFENWKVEIDARVFSNFGPRDLLSNFRNDDFFSLKLIRYF